MAVISVPTTRRPAIITDDEFQGLWLNIGIMQAGENEGDEATFVRLPRGVAVSDLKPRKIYDNMDPEFATQAVLMNSLIQEIQKKALTLKEGESIPVNLSIQLYRRQEESVQAPSAVENQDLADALFA